MNSIELNPSDIFSFPSDWEKHKFYNLFTPVKETSEKYSLEKVLSLTQNGILEKDIQSNKGQMASSYEKYIKVEIDDIVFNPMDLLSGWVDVVLTQGLISPSYLSFRPNKDKVNSTFIAFYFQTLYVNKMLYNFGKGVATHDGFGRWSINEETILKTDIYIPSKEIQDNLVKYLSEKIAVIDKLKSKNLEKINLLIEQKKSTINEFVTSGLNKEVEKKFSGIEWIGNIPRHWKTGKLFQCCRLTSGATPSRDEPKFWDNGNIPWMTSGEVNKKHVKHIDNRITQEGFKNSSVEMLQKGTVMVGLNGQGKTKGTAALLYTETTCNQSLCALIPNKNITSEYLFYYIESQYLHLRGLVGEGKREGLTVSLLSRYPIIVPPIEEQRNITKYIENRINNVNKLIEKLEIKIKLLKEYKHSLILNVVLGELESNNE